jgi:glycosyltransferase involved in cell wall biosynthesis
MLSIIIPMHGQSGALSHVLRSLARQTLDPDAFEVVVVDDGSPQPIDTSSVSDAPDLRVRVVTLPVNVGRAAARNAGAAKSTGTRLLFLDSDCVAHPDLARQHAAGGMDDIAVVGRRIEPDWGNARHLADASTLPVEVELRQEDIRFDSPADWEVFMAATPWMYAWSTNVSYPRAAFEAIGGFDETFRQWGWEDTELAYRFYVHWARDGERFRYDKNALCYHVPHYADVDGRWSESITSGLDYLFHKHQHYEIERLGTWSRIIALTQGTYDRFLRRVDEVADASVVAQVELALPEPCRRLWAGRGWTFLSSSPTATLDITAAASERNRQLLGIRTPWADDSFDDVVCFDEWRVLMVYDLSAMLRESLRLAPVVYLVGTTNLECRHPVVTLESCVTALEPSPYLVTVERNDDSMWIVAVSRSQKLVGKIFPPKQKLVCDWYH